MPTLCIIIYAQNITMHMKSRHIHTLVVFVGEPARLRIDKVSARKRNTTACLTHCVAFRRSNSPAAPGQGPGNAAGALAGCGRRARSVRSLRSSR